MAASQAPVAFSGRRQSATRPAATKVSPAVIAKAAVSHGLAVVVAREDERDGDDRLDERDGAREPEPQRPHRRAHGSREVIAAPDSSAFGDEAARAARLDQRP